MQYMMFADESGTSPPSKCFTIGALLVPERELEEFETAVSALADKHGLPREREIKWERVKKSHGLVNFGIDLLQLILKTNACFTAFVAWKECFYVWKKDEEKAFYMSYTLLVEHSAKILSAEVKAHIDHRNDSYDKNPEVVQIIANHKLKNYLGSISAITQRDSKDSLLIQVADFLTGAINAAHNKYLDSKFTLHPGKEFMIGKLAGVLGWDTLWYDTYPNAGFNVWHFPWQEFRGKPKTEKVVPDFGVKYVSPEELAAVVNV